ncbi:MAG: prophage MuMc02 head decoration protein [Bacteroidetes bacterium]|nr:MAG: prophage MuMc02 head decoration protein [Bacteroidota bacterium]
MSTILTKRYQREKDIPTTGLQAGELIIAIDTRSLWMCISTDERVKVSDNFNPDDYLQTGLNLSDVPEKSKARQNLEVYSIVEIDHLLQGLRWKAPVKVITTRSIELAREQEIDGVFVLIGDRVLVNNQSARYENGIYVVSGDQWTRAEDADTSDELLNAAVFVSQGTTYADTAWVCSTDPPIVIGTSTIRFVQFSALTYVHPSGFTSQPPTSNLANAVVISRILVNSEGHITGINTRSLTPANIGAAPASHAHALHTRGNGLTGSNYDGSAPVSWAVDFAGNGQAVTVARSDHNHDNQYAPYGHNHYLTSLADVLIDTLEHGDVLSYDSAADNWVNVAAGIQFWSKNSYFLSPATPNDCIYLETNRNVALDIYCSNDGSSGTTVGISSWTPFGIGVYGGGGLYGVFADGGDSATGLFATSFNGVGAEIITESGHALSATATGELGNAFSAVAWDRGFGASIYSKNGLPMAVGCNHDTLGNTVYEMIRLERNYAGGQASDGIGAAIDFHIQGSGSSFLNSRFASTLTTALNLHITSNFEWSLINDGLFDIVMDLSGSGILNVKSGYKVNGTNGLSGSSTVITGVSYNSITKTLVFTRSSMSISGGIVTSVNPEQNLNIDLS